jgi:hypothetical protein
MRIVGHCHSINWKERFVTWILLTNVEYCHGIFASKWALYLLDCGHACRSRCSETRVSRVTLDTVTTLVRHFFFEIKEKMTIDWCISDAKVFLSNRWLGVFVRSIDHVPFAEESVSNESVSNFSFTFPQQRLSPKWIITEIMYKGPRYIYIYIYIYISYLHANRDDRRS